MCVSSFCHLPPPPSHSRELSPCQSRHLQAPRDENNGETGKEKDRTLGGRAGFFLEAERKMKGKEVRRATNKEQTEWEERRIIVL